ncbi:flagellin [Hydrogenispora ethanolica]|uniref:Flagellin n=1 Tax=Hydrogenispora ethanolica TaxID=1082276 RepID=A0A4R1RYC9_HYDET|nr:flagellin [Hydrogenispora ethanolica]TCL70982.1 flagellin [Hydrogenispora ethanolica]
MRINHNIPALSAFRNLDSASNVMSKSMEKLSSGLRINRAADDAAGLAISETMRSQIKGLTQATRNSQDAISLIQTAEGALTETHAILDRMRELADQAANATYTANDRMEMQKEIDQLKDEIDRIGNTTTFNNKNLLDGSASAIISSDNANTSVFVRGAVTNSGAYTLSVDATAGQGQIQKTNVFKVKEGDVVSNLVYDASKSGISKVNVNGVQHGKYEIDIAAGNPAAGGPDASLTETSHYFQNGAASIFGTAPANVAANTAQNASLLFEVTGVAGDNVSYKISYHVVNLDGTVLDGETTASANLSAAGSIALGAGLPTIDYAAGLATNLKVGDKATYFIKADANTGVNDTVTSKYDANGDGDYADTGEAKTYVLNAGVLNNKASDFKMYSLDSNGKVYDSNIALTVGGLTTQAGAVTFTAEDGAGKLASLDTKLSAIDKFTDANGKFLLDQPKTITLIQGDGKKTSVQLYASDTLKDVVNKLNKAIADDLGQGEIVGAANADKFVSYVTTADPSGVEATGGSMVIRSAKAGTDGQINIVGDEEVIKALGLSNLQDATESNYSVTVTDATNPSNVIAQNVSIQGNKIVGVVDENVDVQFDSQADITTTWDATTKTFKAAANASSSYKTTINVVNNSQTFQIGANEGQDMTAAIGDMRAAALGVDNILITDRESASKAVTVIDAAKSRVSAQRSSLGAVQNRLEHTINNLGVATENMTASESRIRDVDMASEMMEYTKMNILSQASQAMLAQANQKPQQALQLLQG